MAPPKIQTYHCLCTSLLLSTTHTLSLLPRRSSPSTSSPATDLNSSTPLPASDAAIILPLPSTPPLSSLSSSPEDEDEEGTDLPSEGYTVLLGLVPDRKTTIVRREDGFEKRILYRCSRCSLIVGYELQSASSLPSSSDTNMDMDVDSRKGKGKEAEKEYDGKILYILPGGMMSTEVLGSGRQIVGFEEGDVGFVGTGTGGRRGMGVFE